MNICLHDFEVRGILDGTITEIWRPVKNVPPELQGDPEPLLLPDANGNWWLIQDCTPPIFVDKCPFGQPGDWIWCRETWAFCTKAGGHYIYKADGDGFSSCHVKGYRWQSPVTATKACSRITLINRGVECRTVNSMTNDEYKASGTACLDYYRQDPVFGHVWAWRMKIEAEVKR